MPLNISLPAAVIAASLWFLPALAMPQNFPGQDQSSAINGIVIADIPDAPFSATAVIEIERLWPDDSTETFRTINLIARDTSGRTHNEKRRFMPENFHGSPQLMTLSLFDPHTRMLTVCDPSLHMARRSLVPKKATETPHAGSASRSEDLGTTTLNGLQAKGTRHSFTIPAKASGIGEAVKIEDEEWYSEDLHINLLVRHSDPRIGTVTIGLSSLKREEPAASMFEVPAGYQILNLSPTQAPVPQLQAAPPTAAEPNP